MDNAKYSKILADMPYSMFFLSVSALLYTPILMLYAAGNPGSYSLISLLRPALTCLVFLLVPFLMWRIWRRPVEFIDTIMLGPALYISATCIFYPVQGGVLDGRSFVINALDKYLHFGLMAVCIIIGIIALYKPAVKKMSRKIVAILGIFSLVAAMFMSASAIPFAGGSGSGEIHYASLSSKNNIVVLVLDMVQGNFAEEHFKRNPAAEEAFDGFIFFKNAASSAPYTALSYAGFMRGSLPKGKSVFGDIDYDDNIIDDMTKSGYTVRYFSTIQYQRENEKVTRIPLSFDLSISSGFFNLVFTGTRRYIPFALESELAPMEFGWFSKTDARDSFEWLLRNVHADPEMGKGFSWFHTLLTHQPIRFNREGKYSPELKNENVYEEIFYAFGLVENYIKRLKELGIYDKTLLIVISEHGYNILDQMGKLPGGKDNTVPFGTANHYMGQYYPMIMVKLPGAHGRLRYDDTAVSLLDLRKSLNEFVSSGSGGHMEGISFLTGQTGMVQRTVPALKFSGEEFDLKKDFQSLKNWRESTLQLPLNQNCRLHIKIDSDLEVLKKALDAYQKNHGAYPVSQGFDGLFTSWGRSGKNWIRGLVPRYIDELPRDPRENKNPGEQYLYKSDGIDYKLISHLPPDIEMLRSEHPQRIDPRRPHWAFGFWTEAAKDW